MSQLLIGVIHGPEGGSAAIIDEYYRTFEDFDTEEGFPDQRRANRLFERALRTIQKLFPDLPSDEELRWGNRADFYSLFVAIAQILREHDTPKDKQIPDLRAALERFSREVDRGLTNDDARVAAVVSRYVRTIERGVNDKARRADRHRILVELMRSCQ